VVMPVPKSRNIARIILRNVRILLKLKHQKCLANVGGINEASYTFANLNILVHDTVFMHPALAGMV